MRISSMKIQCYLFIFVIVCLDQCIKTADTLNKNDSAIYDSRLR